MGTRIVTGVFSMVFVLLFVVANASSIAVDNFRPSKVMLLPHAPTNCTTKCHDCTGSKGWYPPKTKI